ncbi:uncharacterized protein PADG_03591 [Paracoccidioides brasiliensis Pb18]|uniref:Helicase ATP-binding domain-containing protein n=1 Tax=Paracoccidioides brasiliensis (strain Pb18) TaxID=502780 RepID=C1G8K5_PARBD|nr:uncharacterized protein PADG_03591 [Paracoccidioides brasiliensis Pb18]EEH47507.1 hypothetical protein PADG_03591 [Paracoccidioides brasiliensis Pb18]
MVKEREPPRNSALPSQNNNKPQKSQLSEPVFGQASLLGPAKQRTANPFNIPKPNRPRPEHHLPPQRTQTQQQGKDSRSSYAQAGISTGNTSSLGNGYQRYDPFRLMKPSDYSGLRPGFLGDDSVVEIVRPSNAIQTTQPAAIPMFSSQAKPKMPKNLSNLQNFIDLTGSATNAQHHEEAFGAMDVYSYVDAAKANENIKALLEGAFEDESDKPRARQRRKKIESGVNQLAIKLQKVDVSEAPGDKEMGEEEEEEEEEDDGTVEGLKVKLLPHQREGVEWMRDKECSVKKTRGVIPKGGILADDMGLGKTVQTIALLLTNPRHPKGKETTDEDKEKSQKKISPEVGKGTLVVAPLALIKQWESEIESKVEATHRLRTCIYHGTHRTKYANSLSQFDVVITTYGTLSSEHATSEEKPTGCFAIYWYRVVLDEAHTIKNRNAKATQAACSLKSEYRWCLTGTPTQNNLDELQSLINFLRIKPYNDLASWRDQITKPLNNGRGGLAIRRLQVYLKAFMKRRTKDVLKLDGALGSGDREDSNNETKESPNGFKITNREVLKVEADFTPSEREFYSRLEQRTDKTLERMIGGNSINYASALVLLLRLRQACNHPDLVKSDLAQDKDVLTGNFGGSQSKNPVKEEDVDDIANLMGGLSVITKLCDVCQTELSAREAKSGTSRCVECEADLETQVVSPRKKRDKKKKKKKSEKKQVNAEGSDSFQEISHIARRARLQKQRRIVGSDDEDGDDGEWLLPDNQQHVENLGKAGGTDDEDAEGGGDWLCSDDSYTDEDEDGETSEIHGKSRDVINLDSDEKGEGEDEDGTNDESDDEPETPDHLASTKIRHLMKILKKESGDYKFIVFSFFTSMLTKIEPFLKGANIGYARYDGAMRNDMRENSLDRLRTSPKTRVLLCSLRAGSLGLNLTAASRVVILEPFWNPFVEEQAIDRVHRLNQTIDVKVYKLTIRNTVEERIVDLQEHKRELANATIEGKAAAGKLTMKDMMALFSHEASARYSDDDPRLDLSSKTRLLGSRDDDDRLDYGRSGSTSTSASHSQPSRRAMPPVMERKAGGGSGRRPPPESSVYERRW